MLNVSAPGLAAQDLSTRPQPTPYTVAPSILNRDDVVRAMVREYPTALRDAGIGGTVRIYFFIDAGGTVGNTLIDQSSGNEALDQAAFNVAAIYRFSPARNGDTPVPVWVSFPITFQVR
jgi:protein TonB